MFDYPFTLCVSALWERITEAHTNRWLHKTSSTLTVSSDDLDERDMTSESGLLLHYSPINKLFHMVS